MSVLLPNESNALQMFKYVALSYTLFGCVNSAYTAISGTGKNTARILRSTRRASGGKVGAAKVTPPPKWHGQVYLK